MSETFSTFLLCVWNLSYTHCKHPARFYSAASASQFFPRLWPHWWIHTVGSICYFLFLSSAGGLLAITKRMGFIGGGGGVVVVCSRSNATVSLTLPCLAMMERLHNSLDPVIMTPGILLVENKWSRAAETDKVKANAGQR